MDAIKQNAEQVLDLEPMEMVRQYSGIQLTVRQLLARIAALEAELKGVTKISLELIVTNERVRDERDTLEAENAELKQKLAAADRANGDTWGEA